MFNCRCGLSVTFYTALPSAAVNALVNEARKHNLAAGHKLYDEEEIELRTLEELYNQFGRRAKENYPTEYLCRKLSKDEIIAMDMNLTAIFGPVAESTKEEAKAEKMRKRKVDL